MAIYARDSFDCVYCRGVFPIRLDGKGLTLDHVVPRSQGGKSTAANLVTACISCNCGRKQRALFGREQGRVAAALKKPINRALGRELAKLQGFTL